MQIDVGKFYFIKDEFFEIVNDRELMKNKENSIKRPCYYCFKSKENEKIIWFIPVSTKIDKYEKIYNNKKEKERLESVYTSLLNDEANLEDDVKKLQDPEYVAKYAREKYLYTKEGEYVIDLSDLGK